MDRLTLYSKKCCDVYKLSEILKWSLLIFIVQGFRTIVFIICYIFNVSYDTLSNLLQVFVYTGANGELQTTSFTSSTRVASTDSVNHLRVQELRILLFLLTCCQDWTYNQQIIVSLET